MKRPNKFREDLFKMTIQNCRIRVKTNNFEFEMEGDPSFVLEQFKSIKLYEYLEQLAKK